MQKISDWRATFTDHGGWWVLAQFPLLFLAYYIPDRSGYDAASAALQWARLAGTVLMVLGLLISAGGAITLGRWLTPFPRPLAKSELRTRGAYALVRHPLYSGILFMAFGWSLHTLSIAGVLFDTVLLVFFDRKAAREELWLAEKFTGYPTYCQRVKKLIPWIY
jgi:protein-S-isoprenylcysteine O-methyltransferase Ste14